ncbi:hypothetical protein [Myxococcus sp. AB025B]|uniref:hypothetical protein n=1 Tax=Myxococcus sp. AB025B TaxID=2562794 RepID=UPI001143AB15|nr:hypothetical protein [Myxococcus sp. AB025B]
MKPSRFLALGLLASAPVLAANSPDQYLDLRTRERAVSLRVTEDNLSGPQLQLYFGDDAVRGRAFGRPVNLQVEDDTVKGIYGQGPVDLKVTEDGDMLEAVGTFGGQLSNFRVSPDQIAGNIGRCSYELVTKSKSKDLYTGWRTCGGRLDNAVTLSIPPALAEDDAGLVTALSIVLAQ